MTHALARGKDVDMATRQRGGMKNGPSAASVTSNAKSDQSSTLVDEFQTISEPSTQHSTNSKRHYGRPKNVREFAAQVVDLATVVLNGELTDNELENARVYASLARTGAQLISTQAQRARFLKEAPDMSLEDDG